MKANEVPENLYFGEFDKGGLAAYSTKESNDEIEYTRTDAFIEKAATWLREQEEMVGVSFQEDFIERFKDYMKGK